jgi:hypothetical protein
MKKIDLGQTISIMANVGVIASIIFLGVQLRDGSIQARIATNQELVSQLRDWDQFVAADAELAAIYARGMTEFAGLTPTEQVRFDFLMRSRIRAVSSGLLAQEYGVLRENPDLSTSALIGQLVAFVEQPGFREWWTIADRRGLPSRMISLVDELHEQR